MRRSLFVFIVMGCLAVTLLPASASAKTWVVKSPHGAKMGTVVQTASRQARVSNAKGSPRGGVWWISDVKQYIAAMSHPGDSGMRKEVWLDRGVLAGDVCWWLRNDLQGWLWYCTKVHSRWTVSDAGGNPYGSVSGQCPGWAAAGAVFDLSNKLGQ